MTLTSPPISSRGSGTEAGPHGGRHRSAIPVSTRQNIAATGGPNALA